MTGTWNHSREGAELRGPRHPVPTTVLPHLAGISLLTADSSNETHVHDPQSSRVWSHSTEQGFHRGDELREPAGLSSVPMEGLLRGPWLARWLLCQITGKIQVCLVQRLYFQTSCLVGVS